MEEEKRRGEERRREKEKRINNKNGEGEKESKVRYSVVHSVASPCHLFNNGR